MKNPAALKTASNGCRGPSLAVFPGGAARAKAARSKIFESRQAFPDDFHRSGINDLIVAARFLQDIFQRLFDRLEGVEIIFHAAEGTACVISE